MGNDEVRSVAAKIVLPTRPINPKKPVIVENSFTSSSSKIDCV